MKHTLEIDSVELSFRDRNVLQGVYLRGETGAVTGLLGSNGSGKSCLMNVLFGTLRPAFKSLRIDGVWHDRFSADEVRYLPQHPFLPDKLRIGRVFRDFGLDAEDFSAGFPNSGNGRTAGSVPCPAANEGWWILCNPLFALPFRDA